MSRLPYLPVRQFSFILPAILALSTFSGCRTQSPDADIHTWAADAIWYQIFPERFRNGDPGNDPTSALDSPAPIPGWQIHPWGSDFYKRQSWELSVRADDFYSMHTYRRYGGDLQGVIDKLDYLAGLGINAIYLNPIFNADSHHKYDGSTHTHIDYYFGPDPEGDRAMVAAADETGDPATWVWTSADMLFLTLLGEAHTRGMRVITEGVFNHVGRSHFAFQDVLENQQASPYADWFEIVSWDDPETPEDEFEYKGWWGHQSLPEINEEDGTVVDGPKQYLFGATARWMDPNGDGDPSDGVDGWRLDAVDDMGTRWWREWHAFIRTINPHIFTIAEVWDTRPQLLSADLFSATMNYPFAMAVIDFVANREKKLTPSAFDQRLATVRDAYGIVASRQLQNLIDSHDTDRLASMIINPDREYAHEARPDEHPDKYFIRKPNAAERRQHKLIVALHMTHLGAPMIYYGDEVGMWGERDPGVRKPMLWDDITFADETHHPLGWERPRDAVAPDKELLAVYREAIALRNNHPALRRGDYRLVTADDDNEILVFERWTEDERLIIAVNNADQERSIALDKVNPAPLFIAGDVELGEFGNITLGPRTLIVMEAAR